jgi:hypothetical protein
MEPYPRAPAATEDADVQVLSSSRSLRPPIGATLIGLSVGATLVIGGIFLGWVAFATPVLTGAIPSGRSNPTQLAIGAAVWAFSLVAPASFAIIGTLRIGSVARAITARPPVRATNRLEGQLGDEYTAANDVRLPDGRIVHNLVLGPFGFAVIAELPPPAALRHHGMAWEIRSGGGRWRHIENPLERTARDGERVRRWVSAAERDFVVKVYSAVITADPTIARTAGCAVVTAEQLPAWLASLPPSRQLSEDRRADLADELRQLL